MKNKVIIISYFAPPSNLTAANRIDAWMKYLPLNDIYPILITRNWTGKEDTEAQRVKNSGVKERIVKLKLSEIHYLPYYASLRDRFFVRGQNNFIFKILSKILTFISLVFQNVSVHFIPYNNFYFYAKKMIQKDKEIETVVISGNPFEQYYFGYLLKIEFPHINWIVDYRDDWTTNKLSKKHGLAKVINSYNQFFEKKWIRKADKITSVSEIYCTRLFNLHNKPCHLIMNGYKSEIHEIKPLKANSAFTLSYSGTIYENQNFEPIIKATHRLANKYPTTQFKIQFIGGNHYVPSSFIQMISTYKAPNLYLELTDRISWEKTIGLLKSSSMLLLSAYGNLKGIPSSKLYDYIACNRPILLYPSDNDVMEHTLNDTNTGYIARTQKELEQIIENQLLNRLEFKPNLSAIENYASSKQVQKLASLIKKNTI